VTANILKLFPGPASEVELEGLYLNAPLLPDGWGGEIFVYANFVTSLDGRIAVTDSHSGLTIVPGTIANPRDWRLFQELAAHADVLLSSGRYLRDLEAGVAQDSLPLGHKPEFADLRRWRLDQGLPAQPDIAVMSRSLDFKLPREWFEDGRRVLILTTADASEERADSLRLEGAEVVRLSGAGEVGGQAAVARLQALGYRRLYCVAGPYVLRALLADAAVDTLFLTTVHRLIGGSDSPGILEGAQLPSPVDFKLTSLYFDAQARKNLGQSLARYDRPR
jgi:riboflavin biosynthesis pyrimidine reductase